MQYGHFDDEAREYVITRPDTPASWSNYLGSTEYGAVITNNAGGYGFYKSAARGRFLRLNFNSIPMDQPGRYFYIRDRENGDYWSTSWQPVAKPLDQYESTCRHGTAYTIIESKYDTIKTEATYFVPLGQTFEYWRLKVTNTGGTARKLSAFTFCEFTNQWDTRQDGVNLQYSLFINRGTFEDNMLRLSIQDNLTSNDATKLIDDVAAHMWMTLVGGPIAGYDTSRQAFIGTYGDYGRPAVLQDGACTNSNAYGDNSCGTLQSDMELAPGESAELLVLMGIGNARTTGKRIVAEYASLERAAEEFDRLKKEWHARLNDITVKTPDPAFDHLVNVWGLYNCIITFAWSRAASLVYNGERDGLGYRDSVQDILGVAAAIPEEATKRVELLLTGQLANGGAIPVIRPFEHNPGHETPPPLEHYRSDDCLWFFNAIPALLGETGDEGFYDKVLPYADEGEATVLGHLRRALEFNLERTGRNGLPCGLAADWNDCLKLGYHGESLFVAFQLRLGLTTYAEIADRLGKSDESTWALTQRDALDAKIQACSWDGDRFIWAFGEDGTVYGTRDSKEGSIYFNTQVWSVMSDAATPEQAATCMETVNRELATPYGLMLCSPPFVNTSIEVMRAVVFNPGIKENAGIFNHTQGWGVIAECMLGNGDRAYEYLAAANPASWNEKAEIRQAEPYVQCQTTYSTHSPRPGNARTSWLTGAATWAYHAATAYVLGLKAELDGLRIDPCIPSSWDGYTAERRFRGKHLSISVANPDRVCRGVKSIRLNGEKIDGNLVPVDQLADTNTVEVVLEA